MSEWQPMETAPRDGTEVDLVFTTAGPSAGWRWECDAFTGPTGAWLKRYENGDVCWRPNDEPRYWMPLRADGLKRRDSPQHREVFLPDHHAVVAYLADNMTFDQDFSITIEHRKTGIWLTLRSDMEFEYPEKYLSEWPLWRGGGLDPTVCELARQVDNIREHLRAKPGQSPQGGQLGDADFEARLDRIMAKTAVSRAILAESEREEGA